MNRNFFSLWKNKLYVLYANARALNINLYLIVETGILFIFRWKFQLVSLKGLLIKTVWNGIFSSQIEQDHNKILVFPICLRWRKRAQTGLGFIFHRSSSDPFLHSYTEQTHRTIMIMGNPLSAESSSTPFSHNTALTFLPLSIRG